MCGVYAIRPYKYVYDNCRGELHSPDNAADYMRKIVGANRIIYLLKIGGEIHGILSIVSHPGMKLLTVYRREIDAGV